MYITYMYVINRTEYGICFRKVITSMLIYRFIRSTNVNILFEEFTWFLIVDAVGLVDV